MLSRRHIRIKVLQALYEYFQNEGTEMTRGNKRLMESIHGIYDLYLFELKALSDLLRIAEDEIDRRKNKRLPTADDLNPSTRFVDNMFLNWLKSNVNFNKQIELNHVSWGENRDALRNIYKQMEASEEYAEYIALPENSIEADKKFIKWVYGTYIVNSDLVHQLYEDKNMHWADDLDAAQMMVAKTIKRFSAEMDEFTALPKLIKDSDDLSFAETLYKKCIANSEAYEELIHEKAVNWEMDRIALIDIILMKQAIAELTNFKEIPIKVTFNEYIELSKEYSTPKSGNFINGILDKLKTDLVDKGDIRKIGRGLL
ncbi:transcription antitermination factor NusB [Owenweeksia hongkongensis]|uniref:Transcription antitermination factor NusB n=1 Tax=Owenweeksia hongkongensis (strain DSM 17368 / CIP 108786 / JCM 12287 / NRRL B-23963 / UST20020801) TaxID=926562 RepID=G8R2S2_OWEHD|nr:transcription antitermination factor NusB [Owenweeksia hongkongensis]AEV31877.1 transcription antitermination factor NusB [Owenweeksia hongkongensis DSM 17368]